MSTVYATRPAAYRGRRRRLARITPGLALLSGFWLVAGTTGAISTFTAWGPR
jgi:hypothetical protein